ncbi:hypothetical protein EVAR_65537_1 [Eumeta japonica]|uniref:Uncharacterized protein n=1 Tax=Eumeta variegata TaxID=151549 RepID=A0A4C1ZX79_EUMVA|nr:hypothetical protein EVAR_65537_1 [Eumeta japonica]
MYYCIAAVHAGRIAHLGAGERQMSNAAERGGRLCLFVARPALSLALQALNGTPQSEVTPHGDIDRDRDRDRDGDGDSDSDNGNDNGNGKGSSFFKHMYTAPSGPKLSNEACIMAFCLFVTSVCGVGIESNDRSLKERADLDQTSCRADDAASREIVRNKYESLEELLEWPLPASPAGPRRRPPQPRRRDLLTLRVREVASRALGWDL